MRRPSARTRWTRVDCSSGVYLLLAYEIGLVGLKSATLGKMVVGIEIVRKVDGQAPVGLATAVMRWLPFAIGYIPITTVSNLSTLVLLASLVLVFADDLRRSVYDFAGQTYVVRKPRHGVASPSGAISGSGCHLPM